MVINFPSKLPRIAFLQLAYKNARQQNNTLEPSLQRELMELIIQRTKV